MKNHSSDTGVYHLIVGVLHMRRFQRVAGVLSVLLIVLLIVKLMSSGRPLGPFSAITCKSKIAELVIPIKEDRVKYIASLGNDAMSIENDYFNFVSTLTRSCFSQMHLGPEGDGGWDICVERQYDIRKPCLVYSFGVGDEEFLFERSVQEKLGCEVHAFDPSMGMPSKQFSPDGYFHDMGLDSADTYAMGGRWKMRRLKTIMKELGHTGRTLDLLKMDIEFSEWTALHDMLKTGLVNNIRQLVMEIHTPEMDIHHKPDFKCTWSTRETMAFMLKTLIDLHNSGFNMYYSTTNYRTQFKSGLTNINRYCCHNVHMLNTKHKDNQLREEDLA